LTETPSSAPSSSEIRAYAYRLLGAREHAVEELRQKLQRKWPDGDVDGLVEALVEEHLLSDQRFVESFVRSRIQRSQGPLKIRSELRARGVSDALIGAELDGPRHDWTDLAAVWLRRQHPGSMEYMDKTKYYRRLLNRGFTHDQAMDALKQADRSPL